MPEAKPVLLLIDAHALVHRAFHALPALTASKTGEVTGAVYGFAAMFLKALHEVSPTHVAAAFDRPVPTFRHQQFEAYKAQRPKSPPELATQFTRVRQLLAVFNVPIFELDGFEADDVLGTICQRVQDDVDVIIATGDADAMQLVNHHVRVLTPRKGFSETQLYDEEAVRERYGVSPAQIPDLKALQGDASDNIPGVPGVGEKTAAKLIRQFGPVEKLLEQVEEVTPPRLRDALRDHAADARQSKMLATIVRDVDIPFDLEACRAKGYDRGQVLELLRELEFRSLLSRLPEIPTGGAGMNPEPATTALSAAPPLSQAGKDGPPSSRPPCYRVVASAAALSELVAELAHAERIVVDTETTHIEPMRADLVGIAIGVGPGQAYYIPVGHRAWSLGDRGTLESLLPAQQPEQLPLDTVRASLKPFLEDLDIAKIAHNAKYDSIVLAEHDLPMQGPAFDTMIAAYLLNEKGVGLKDLAFSRLGVEMTPITALIGSGAKQITMAQVSIATAAPYAAADADMTGRLRDQLAADLKERGLWDLFTQVEMPLVPVLVDMERRGVALNLDVLREMSQRIGQELLRLEAEIYNVVGHRFNVNSTQQLGQVLFQELRLPSSRRTKTGYSTDAGVLEDLRGQHEIIDLLLEYRQLGKLKSTYVDALPALINPRTQRVHTSFNQTATSTGRLSSSDPNLQNIPVRTSLGRQVRRAFVAGGADYSLLSADYSQVELRILAHFSQDPRLLAAFQAGEDVHRSTAAAVLGLPLDQVTSEMRERAKRVNFGVVYGISDYGLSQWTDLSRREAGVFIDAYFQQYRGVRDYMERTKRQAREQGYVQTLLGRRRPIPEIHSPSQPVRAAAERMAINMPVQGTAADIMKLAMIGVHNRLRQEGRRGHLTLQVHDELLLEVPDDEVLATARLVKEVMEGAWEMDVRLKVDVKVGRNWDEMEDLELEDSGA